KASTLSPYRQARRAATRRNQASGDGQGRVTPGCPPEGIILRKPPPGAGVITGIPRSGGGMANKRIGILTGGGDVPGLNAVIKSVTYRASENQLEVFGLRRGWEALTHVNVDDPCSTSNYVLRLECDNTRT